MKKSLICFQNCPDANLWLSFSWPKMAYILTKLWAYKRSLISSYLKFLLTKASAEIHGFGCSFCLWRFVLYKSNIMRTQTFKQSAGTWLFASVNQIQLIFYVDRDRRKNKLQAMQLLECLSSHITENRSKYCFRLIKGCSPGMVKKR